MKVKRIESKVKRYSIDAMQRKSFKMVSIHPELPYSVKYELAEMNRLILIWRNYQTTARETQEIATSGREHRAPTPPRGRGGACPERGRFPSDAEGSSRPGRDPLPPPRGS